MRRCRQPDRCCAFVLIAIASIMATGCAGMPLPKTIAKGDVAVLRKKRSEEFAQQFDQRRDFAEFEAARNLWLEQRDPEGCRASLEKLLARRPEHCEARLLMAELLLSEGDPAAAYQQAQKALSGHPNEGRVHFTVALTLDAQGNTKDALAYYDRATKMDPQNEDFAAAYQAAREMTCGEAAATDGEVALTYLEGVGEPAAAGMPVTYLDPLSQGPTIATPANGRGNGDSAGSVDSAAVATLGPAGDLLRKGHQALAEGSPQAAMDWFRQAEGAKPDNPQIPISAAAIALRANRPELAVELLTAAARRFPNSAAVHRMLGASQYRTGDYASSQVALQQALSLDKSSALSYLLLGCTLSKLGQNQAAEANFRQARMLDPKYTTVR